MSMPANKKSLAFTLIELLVVVSIIGLLATLVTANLNAARSRSRDTVRKADLKNLQTALRLYYNDNGGYPSAIDALTVSNPVYMNKIPSDPLPDQTYSYINDSLTDMFYLTACLENTSDANCSTVAVGTTQPDFSCSSSCFYQIKP